MADDNHFDDTEFDEADFDDGAELAADVDEDVESDSLHPRFRARRAEVEDQTNRSRKRKLIAFAIVLVVALLAAASTQSALFDVDEVRIVGATRSSPDALREVAGIELGTPVLGLDTSAAVERLLELPEVQTATASSTWSGIVTVEINERIPVARIESDGGSIIVAADGVVIEVVERAVVNRPELELDPTLKPELEALPDDLAQLTEIAGAIFVTERGNQIPDVLTDALAVANALPTDIAVITERVEITVDSLVLKAVGGGLISLGDARDLDQKFDAVRAFLAQVDLSCLETLNVRAPSVPVIRRTPNC